MKFQPWRDDDSVKPPVSTLRTRIGRTDTVEFRIEAIGGMNHRYLNSMNNYQDPECFTVVIEPGKWRRSIL